MIEQIHLRHDDCLSDEEADALAAELLDERAFSRLVTTDADVFKPDGTVLLHFRKKAISPGVCAAAYPNLRDAAGATNNRGIASGKFDPKKAGREDTEWVFSGDGTRARAVRKSDGTVSNTTHSNVVHSGIIGYFDRSSRFPYCRTTAYNLSHPERFAAALPFIREVNGVFRDVAPGRWAAQKKVIDDTHPDFTIRDTVFTTVTVNKNWQTAVHKDAGDYAEGFGVMTAFTGGGFGGCFLTFPKYRVAVDMRTTDVLLADVHEWHGNTPIRPTGTFERISCVFYYREGMHDCGSPAEELERAKARGALHDA